LPAIAELRHRVAAGDLGTLLHVEGDFCVDRFFKLRADSGDWKTDATQVLPGALADHPLYLSIELMGPITEVHATASRRAIAAPIMDTTAVLLRFRSGGSGLLTAIGATANYERLTVFGSKGWAEVRDGWHFAFRPLEGKNTATDYAKIDTERAEMEAFATAVAGTKPFPVPVDDAVHSAAVLEAMGQSAAIGRPVAIA
jgi:predicted dehydrogenase